MGQIPVSGHGEFTYPGGNKYCGNFLDYKREGWGKMTFPDMTAAEGTWKNDELIKGKITYLDGSIYNGELLDFDAHGYGKYQYPNGDIYEGEWRKDKQHGYGKMIYLEENESYEGEWENDQANGNGKQTMDDGTIYEGVWKNHDRNGNFTIHYKNGKKMYVKFKDGELDKTKCKIVAKIPQEEFAVDIPLLTQYLVEPLVVKKRTQHYELIFEGSIEDDIPVEGDLYIPGVFQFSGKWRSGLPNCRSILYDTKEKTATEVHFIDGVDILN